MGLTFWQPIWPTCRIASAAFVLSAKPLFSFCLKTSNSFFGTAVVIDGGSGGNDNGVTGDPMLGALADNGGTVFTRAPLAGSSLISAGDNTLLPVDSFDIDGDGNTSETLPRDANGNTRVLETLDIGAAEFTLGPIGSANTTSLPVGYGHVDGMNGEMTPMGPAISDQRSIRRICAMGWKRATLIVPQGSSSLASWKSSKSYTTTR